MSAIGPFAVPILAVGAFAATLGWFGYQHMTRSPAGQAPTPSSSAVASLAPEASGKNGGNAEAASAPSGGDVANPTPQLAGDSGGKPSQVAVARPDVMPERPSGPQSGAVSPSRPPAGAAGVLPTGPNQPANSPAFDVVRVEPDGETVVAGRAAPGATVELLLNGLRHSRVVADPSGLFALVPDSLPPGGHELVLQVTNGDGSKVRSPQSVTVVLAANRRDPPLVTIMTPGQPAVVLSRPDEPAAVAAAKPAPADRAMPDADRKVAALAPRSDAMPPAATGSGARSGAAETPSPAAKARPSVLIASVEAEGAGKLLVSAKAAPAAVVRLYLNETFIAPGSAAADGRVAFAIEKGMQPGAYKVRLDDVDPVSGQVRSRAEVPFEMPRQVAARTAPAQPNRPGQAAATNAEKAEAPLPRVAAAGGPPQGVEPEKHQNPASGRPIADSATTVVVPEINTAVVSRGDSLWAISKRAYGEGVRYTVIYGANAEQIRDPDLIYPGQLFVLPVAGQERAAR